MQSYSLKRNQRDIDFRQSEIFASLKQKTNILRSLFVITKLKQSIYVVLAKTTLTTKITN